MAKPNAFVKLSGNLLDNPAVILWLRELTKAYYVAICIGGGEQINKAFEQAGYPVKFGPMGRVTSTLAQRQLARNVLEQNQALVQDLLDDHGISARAIVPVDNIGGVLCHVNGDVMLLAAYNGYDKLYMLTTEARVEKKRIWLRQLAEVFEAIEKGELDKIEVIGF